MKRSGKERSRNRVANRKGQMRGTLAKASRKLSSRVDAYMKDHTGNHISGRSIFQGEYTKPGSMKFN